MKALGREITSGEDKKGARHSQRGRFTWVQCPSRPVTPPKLLTPVQNETFTLSKSPGCGRANPGKKLGRALTGPGRPQCPEPPGFSREHGQHSEAGGQRASSPLQAPHGGTELGSGPGANESARCGAGTPPLPDQRRPRPAAESPAPRPAPPPSPSHLLPPRAAPEASLTPKGGHLVPAEGGGAPRRAAAGKEQAARQEPQPHGQHSSGTAPTRFAPRQGTSPAEPCPALPRGGQSSDPTPETPRGGRRSGPDGRPAGSFRAAAGGARGSPAGAALRACPSLPPASPGAAAGNPGRGDAAGDRSWKRHSCSSGPLPRSQL